MHVSSAQQVVPTRAPAPKPQADGEQWQSEFRLVTHNLHITCWRRGSKVRSGCCSRDADCRPGHSQWCAAWDTVVVEGVDARCTGGGTEDCRWCPSGSRWARHRGPALGVSDQVQPRAVSSSSEPFQAANSSVEQLCVKLATPSHLQLHTD